MLTHHRKPVCLSLISTDLPVWSVVETAATLYQKDRDRFHLLLTTPPVKNCKTESFHNEQKDLSQEPSNAIPNSPRVLWLEISPYRVIMTMQGNNQLSYRHFWEQGVYGITRYWLPSESMQHNEPIRMRNFTRDLKLDGHPFPKHLRVEYELWTGEVQLGNYILQLDIKH
ncbi:hypothetical protein WA1_19590 [Scytonema hofmannii PCC 7110]|uniref:Uncharacterized protein n=1 Tax=Scytonema hofmannii PCC 7110 TaxID=128403 RepID=A0A139XBW6_9CYAN|nr:hypothetical protein [Scytonema hofmannii]KYC42190.1 hypothetical protein WA1_19590 [Scytonema hofmannii PCC 7110]